MHCATPGSAIHGDFNVNAAPWRAMPRRRWSWLETQRKEGCLSPLSYAFQRELKAGSSPGEQMLRRAQSCSLAWPVLVWEGGGDHLGTKNNEEKDEEMP